MIRKLTIAAALSLALPGLAWADFVNGADAYKCDDFWTALAEFRPLAEQGHSEAQYFLASMYEFGDGVTQDEDEAAKWYLKAAEQGETQAQHKMATLYARGKGVAQNLLLAHMWFDIASQEFGPAAAQRDDIARRMAPLQIAEAQRMALAWTPVAQLPALAAVLLLKQRN